MSGSHRGNEHQERTNKVIFREAVELASAEKLANKTLSTFAKDVCSVNTLKNRGYTQVADIAAHLLEILENDPHAYGLHPDAQALEHLKTVARTSTKFGAAKKIQDIHHAVARLTEQIKRRTGEPKKTADDLELQYHNLSTEYPDQKALMAEICNSIALAYLRKGISVPPQDAAGIAQRWAERGLDHLESESRSRQYDLGRRLAQTLSAAARAAITARMKTMSETSDNAERMLIEMDVVSHLTTVMASKKQEHDYLRRMKQPLRAAAAEFHRARAYALITKDSVGEIAATVTMAHELDEILQQTGTLADGDHILATYLIRLCATQVAYKDKIGEDTHEELDRIRTRLIGSLDGGQQHDSAKANKDKATARALRTLFILADNDRNPGRSPQHLGDTIHLADLMMISTYGVIGRLLLAEHLYQSAQAIADGRPLYEQSKMLTISRKDYLKAAKHWYKADLLKTLPRGAAAVLAERAQQALSRKDLTEVGDTDLWPLLQGKGLNKVLVNQLALGAVTGTRPTDEQARQLLDELYPVLTVLESIADERSGPVERHA